MQTQISALKIWQLNKWADMDGSGKFVFWLQGCCPVWLSDLFMFPSVRAEELIKCRWVRRGAQICSLSSVRSHLCDSISPSVKRGQLLRRCWTSRKGRQICCSGELILEMDLSHAVVWKSILVFEEHLVLEALGEWGCVNICKILPLWMHLHPRLMCAVGVGCLLTLNRLSAGTDPFPLFLLIQSPKPFLTLADPVSPMQDVIYFPWSLLLRPLPRLTYTFTAADVYNFPFEGRFLQKMPRIEGSPVWLIQAPCCLQQFTCARALLSLPRMRLLVLIN